MEIGEMDVDQLIECFTVAPRCTRDEIQVVPPSCSVIQAPAPGESFGRFRNGDHRAGGMSS
ncbi:MAG TPA: hypothetical protein VHM48_09275, partial [Candidatus Limnocylindrales bacterium]|nr:hypothetical protein [Candidatus Limnocylindrales bacterium]